MHRTFCRATIPALALLPFLAADARAQGLRISPSVGMYAPVRDLGEIEGASGLVEFGKRESTLAYGLSFDFSRPDRSVGFRIGAVYAGSKDVPIDGVGCVTCGLRSTLAAVGAALVIRPLPDMPVLRPYGLLGAGAKMYDFDTDALTSRYVKDQTSFQGQIGIGITLFPDNGVGLFGELSDFISGFEFADGDGDLQHDMVFLVGITLELRR